jgi:hypothetical protein
MTCPFPDPYLFSNVLFSNQLPMIDEVFNGSEDESLGRERHRFKEGEEDGRRRGEG